MSAPYSKVSQVKLDIKQVVDNLKQLANCDGHEIELLKLKTNTEYLLNRLENLPLEGLKTKLNQRQRKRHKIKLNKLRITKEINVVNKEIESEASVGAITYTVSRQLKPKTHYQFKSVKECQRFLQTFELLEQLHSVRGQNSTETYKFSLQLRQLKSIWNCLLQDKLHEQTSKDVKIQQQWNEVLFGPPEKTYFHNKPDLQDFIRKR